MVFNGKKIKGFQKMYKALIIGAGQIAGGYDNTNDTNILTHAHAYKNHHDFELVGFYDTDFARAQMMAEKWGCKALPSLENIGSIDVASICTPDCCHLKSVKEALKLNPKIIFLEKPISDNTKETEEIIEISKSIPILVNFSRRFVKEFQELSVSIQDKTFGEFKTGTGYYGKGFIHNGSHMINLLELFFGRIESITEISDFTDYSKNDTTKTVILDMANSGKFFMQGVNCNDFTLFELDLIFEKARIRILESGKKIELYEVEENQQYKGYFNLQLSKSYESELDFAMNNAIQNISDFLKNREKLISTPEDCK